MGDVTLFNGEVVTEGGTGKLCMHCHISRRNGEEYASEFHSRFGPHGSPQTDLLVGANAIEYGADIPRSTHIFTVENACAGCHMQDTDAEDPAHLSAGSHTFKPVWDGGTPDDESDDVDLTGKCAQCHGPIDSFDLQASADFDGDGSLEGVQTEVEGLMQRLSLELPPVGEPSVKVTEDYSAAQLKAAYNYLFVMEDGSMGVHNAKYAVGILTAAFVDLTGRDVISVVAASLASDAIPETHELAQNYPNPFNPSTEIRYSVASPADVSLDIYNAPGQRVRQLVRGHHQAGEFTVGWDGKDSEGRMLGAGIYLYTLRAGDFSASRRMLLLP